jgi:hypothetical protein
MADTFSKNLCTTDKILHNFSDHYQLKRVPGRLIFKGKVKVKVKFILEKTMVDQKRSRDITSVVLLHFFFDAKVHVMPQHPAL